MLPPPYLRVSIAIVPYTIVNHEQETVYRAYVKNMSLLQVTGSNWKQFAVK